MAKKRKNQLPSGNIRIQVYDYTDLDGKKHYKSFTAPTKKQAQLLAAEWQANKDRAQPENLTVYEAVSKYVNSKQSVLSPSTLRGYETIQKNYFRGEFGRQKLENLTNKVVQLWVSDLAARVSPKTVRNAYGLLVPALEMFHPDFTLRVTLPAKKRPELYCPSDDDIAKLLDHIKGTELEIAVLLAAFGPLRRGEICALTDQDIHGNIVEVNKSMVQGPDKLWYVKQPKTYGSYRQIEMPDFVIKKMNGIQGRIIKATPAQITNRFMRAINTTKLPHFRFHDLRHYSASIMHAIGVPDQYILQRGGWASDNVMKAVYRNVIDIESMKQNKKIMQHFEKVSHDVSHATS